MMRALTWHGTNDVRVDTVSDPEIINPRDAIIKITSTAICGSDLHLYDGVIPGVAPGDVLGHEFMGEVVETGSASDLKKGQRVVVPFTISCGGCFHCQIKQYSACENSNPAEKQDMSATLYGHPMAALFGYSHLTGGYSGGQAEYVRVPFSDVGPIVIPDHLEDEKVLFLSDILPTGWMGAENAEIQPDDTVAVWGCGPVGLFAVQSARNMGASKVIAIDHYPHRLELAKQLGAEVINFKTTDVREALMERESLGPTGVGHGVALPHARVPDLDEVKGLFILLEKPIDFEAVDRQPVDLVFALFAPEDAGVEHLKALALVSRTLRDANFCTKLRSNPDANKLFTILTEAQSVQAA